MDEREALTLYLWTAACCKALRALPPPASTVTGGTGGMWPYSVVFAARAIYAESTKEQS